MDLIYANATEGLQSRLNELAGLKFFAGEPDLLREISESGPWLLTVVKYGGDSSFESTGWYALPTWGNYYIDVRVAIAALVILILTVVVVPLALSRRGSGVPNLIASEVSAIAGLAYGVALFWYGWTHSYSWIILVELTVLVILIAFTAIRFSMCLNSIAPPRRNRSLS